MSTPRPVIFDTDIGTDVDDILALGVLLGSPAEIDLIGVTTVYGDIDLRARMVRKLLRLRGAGDIAIHAGVRDPILRLDPVWWEGHEGEGLLDERDAEPIESGHAVDYLVQTVLERPGEITLLAVGPLTNVATAILREPAFATSLRNLTIMGGRIDMRDNPGGPAEHNIKCDPEAAHIVFASGAPIDLVPLDVTLRAVIREDGVERLRGVGTPYHDALADQVARYPGFVRRGGQTFLHDPLAAMALLRPDLLSWIDLNVQVELTGRITRAMTVARQPGEDVPATARVALDLDVAACEALIAERLVG